MQKIRIACTTIIFSVLLFSCHPNKKTSTVTGIAPSEKELVLFPAIADSLTGYIDVNGKMIISPRFRTAYSFSEGLAFVSITDSTGGFINTKGDIVISGLRYGNNFSDGLAAVTFQNNKRCYINKKGECIVNGNFEYFYDFKNGLAPVVTKDGSNQFIDKTGKVIVDLKKDVGLFYDVMNFEWAVNAGVKNDKCSFISPKGDTVLTFSRKRLITAGNFSEGLAMVRIYYDSLQYSHCGYIDKTGKLMIPTIYGEAHPFVNGYARVSFSYADPVEERRNKCGYINKNGKLLALPFQIKYTESDFCEGIATINISKKPGNNWNDTLACIDTTGKLLFYLPPVNDFNVSFRNGLARISLLDTYGGQYTNAYINKKGNIVWQGSLYSSICFDPDTKVNMADGSFKAMKLIKEGEFIRSIESPKSHLAKSRVVKVEKHESDGYSLIRLKWYSAEYPLIASVKGVHLKTLRELLVTPNHPVITQRGKVKAGDLKITDTFYFLNERGRMEEIKLAAIELKAVQVKTVYNLKTTSANFFTNGILVATK
jgi:hypothetical protein